MKIKLLILLLILALPIPAAALEEPEVTIYPENISANSSFLISIDMHTINDSIRVTWIAPGVENGYGLFPRIGNRYICYFSNTDPESTCGPNPYTTPFTYTMELNAINQRGETSNKTLTIKVGGIAIISQINLINRTAYIIVLTRGISDSVTYTIYDENMMLVETKRRMDYNPATDKYSANTTLEPGEYYIVFEAKSPTDFGGGVQRLSVPEEVVTDGVPQAGASISIDAMSYNVVLPSPGEEYEISNFKLTNLRTTTLTNLSADIPQELSRYLEIIFEKTTLDENESTYFTVKLSNIRNGMYINASIPVKSENETIGSIPLDIKVSVPIEGGVVTQIAENLQVEPEPIITGDYLETELISREFELQNTGTEDITNISYELSTELEGITDVSIPDSIEGGLSGTATITITPDYTGTYSGTVKIKTSAGSITIVVNVNVFRDMSSELESKRTELEDLKNQLSADMQTYLSGVFDIIESNIDSAQMDFDNKDYSSAEKGYSSVVGQMRVIEDIANLITPSQVQQPTTTLGSGFDPTIAIVIVIIIVIILVVVLKRKGKLKFRKSDEFEEI